MFDRAAAVAWAASSTVLLALSGEAMSAPPADWSKIPVKTVKLFYPGQSTYDWLVTPDHKKGDKQVLQGKSCVSCHENDEADIGKNIVSGKNLEPEAIPGKNPTIDLRVQAAFDDKNLYWRFQWKTNMNRAGQMHGYLRFDGKEWVPFGGPRSSKKVRDGATPPLYEDRLSIMLDDGKVPLFREQGCWLTCHNGMRDSPKEATEAQVKDHPYLGKALKQSDVRKFLPSSRGDAEASWDKPKSAEEIAKIKAAGGFLDLMQWRAHRSNAAGMADDGYVLDYRLFDQGKNPFGSNFDREKKMPRFMFDGGKVGIKSLTVATVGDPAKPHALVREQNAVPFDPNAGWKADDVLPGLLLSRADAAGSAGDNKDVKGTWQDGAWTLTWTRPLDTGNPADDKILKAGAVYAVSFAVHDDNVTTRFHHVSFPFSLGLGVKADIQAVKLP
jgi:hypothetical protein